MGAFRSFISQLILFLTGASAIMGGIIIILLLSLWLTLRSMRANRKQQQMIAQLLQHYEPSKGIEKNLGALLELFGSVIEAPVYSFYVSKNGQYLLKSVRHSETDFGNKNPSLRGSGQKETYMPPISLASSSVPSTVSIITEGEVPLLVVPMGGRGVVYIGPIRQINKRVKKTIETMAEHIGHVLPEIVLAESMRNQIDVVLASNKALQNISDAAVDPVSTLELLIGACSRAVGADGGIFLEENPATKGIIVKACSGIDPSLKKELQADSAAMSNLMSHSSNDGYRLIHQGDPDYIQLPSYVSMHASVAVCAVSVGAKGTLVLLFNQPGLNQDVGLDQLTRIAEELNDIIVAQAPLEHLSKVYVNILKQLARMMDNLNPYTVGYSEQMSRYSIVIAKQMKLPEEEIRDIALAAYLSNIGVLGLSSELYQKEGKYTETEYEMMKLHSEVGASIVSVTTGNKRVASYIMYHHERMDGGGYPTGLRGEEIPTGARIIAVVQTFLAKINGRKGRDPLPFDQALKMLGAASGSQLDQQVVNALIAWFQNKRSDPKLSNYSLGSCWEMCCSPSSICEHCPVYMNNDSKKHCWDYEDNLCSAHGKTCATCFVKTEFYTRSDSKRLA